MVWFADVTRVLTPIKTSVSSVQGSYRAAKRNLSDVYSSTTSQVAKFAKSESKRVAKAAGELFAPENIGRTVKATTRNTQTLVQQGSLVGGAGGALLAKAGLVEGAALTPVIAAATAFDLTLHGIVKLEDLAIPGEVDRIEEGEFKKQTALGRTVEQFLRGDISKDLPNLTLPVAAADAVAGGERQKQQREADKFNEELLEEAQQKAAEALISELAKSVQPVQPPPP